MPFRIRVSREFSAAHQLRLADGSLEALHGHNWRVKVGVSSAGLDGMGVVMDFHELERLIDGILSCWHNRHLNDVPAFARLNPSAENVALQVAEGLRLPAGVVLESVEVWETAGNSALYRP